MNYTRNACHLILRSVASRLSCEIDSHDVASMICQALPPTALWRRQEPPRRCTIHGVSAAGGLCFVIDEELVELPPWSPPPPMTT